jgi:uncharacterized protein (DUF486 family)
MKTKACLFAASLILMAAPHASALGCISAAGHINTLAYAGAQPYFTLLEYPSNAYTFDPNYTVEQRRILLNLLHIAIVSKFTVQVLCEPTTSSLLGVILMSE